MQQAAIVPHVFLNSGLLWLPSRQVGWHPEPPIEYADEYYQMCVKSEAREITANLNESRRALVRKYTSLPVLDIGIGAGTFVEHMDCFGFDINKRSQEWLIKQGKLRVPAFPAGFPLAMTFWNSIQCIPDPTVMIIQSEPDFIFASLPVFDTPENVVSSKHYKPGENIWYWTIKGFRNFMDDLHYEQIERNCHEEFLGFDGTATFVFKRK